MTRAMFDGLTTLQLLFVYEYLKDPTNATQAAVRAGYSLKSAKVHASVLLSTPVVKAKIIELMEARTERLKIDADWVLAELAKLYECNLDDFLVKGSNPPRYDFSNATREQMAAVESLSIAPDKFGTKVKVRVAGKKALLELIGKHVGVNAWREQIEMVGEVTLRFDPEDEEA